MKKSLFQKALCFILSVTTLFGVLGITAAAKHAPGSVYDESSRGTAPSRDEMQALVSAYSYEVYLNEKGNHDQDASKMETVSVDILNMVDGSTGKIVADSDICVEAMQEHSSNWVEFGEDKLSNSVYLPSSGKTEWNFSVPKAGYYYIKFEYFSCITEESSISSIERKLSINGETPFREVGNIRFDKSWDYTNITTEGPTPTTDPDGCTTEYELRDDEYCKVVTVIKDGQKTVTTYHMTQDLNGNSMAPGISQSPKWNTYYCQDSSGYHQGYFRFYFAGNVNYQLGLAAEREPVIIGSIQLVPYDPQATETPSYDSVKQSYEKNGYSAATGGSMTMIQAEFPDSVSDASVYPSNDKTSSATYPTTSEALLYNVIGKNSYNSLGQWASYKFTVDKTGLYKLSMRFLQSQLQGMYICRSLKLAGGIYGLPDGTPTAPFEEAYDAQFTYSKDWQSEFLHDNNGTEFEFYFEEGKEYTLVVECSLGSLGDLIQKVEESLSTINSAYLKILQLTGSAPDENRDYEFLDIMPEVLITLGEQAKVLEDTRLALKERCGTNGSHIATLGTVALLLDEMSRNDGYNIASNMSNLKSYLGTLGTWINDSKKGILIIDSISVCPADTDEDDLPSAKANFFKSMWYEIKSFFYSFFTDYDQMGVTELNSDSDVTIDVWLALGRDQSNIWRRMIDAQDGFTAKTGYAVKLKLVTGGTLLPSILSGKGPDVYMGLGSADVINYAIRNAVVGVGGSKLPDTPENECFKNVYYTYAGEKPTKEYKGEENLMFESLPYDIYTKGGKYYEGDPSTDADDKVASLNFVDAALDTVKLLDIAYAVPQTMSFSMMFYRMDVLAKLGVEVPETWDDMLKMLSLLQSNNMEIGISYVLALEFMIYQQGGNMWHYADNPEYAGSKIGLDTNVATQAFAEVCKWFTDYSFPISYDAANRFRTGEMPLLVGDYVSLYNTLVVYATEIEGLWKFCPLPGSPVYDENGKQVYDENGLAKLNYSSLASVGATVMLYGCEGEEKLAAWEFMQWQTWPDVQSNYGNNMVALIGPAAKYETANVNAIKDLSWTADEYAAIADQMSDAHMDSVVNYPGSYYYGRYLKFAFLDVVNDGADPYDALSQYIDAINAEITRKREEFDLKTGDPE